MSGGEFVNLDLSSKEAPQVDNKEESCNAEEDEEGEIQEEGGANEIEQGGHANSEEPSQLENLKESSNAKGEIPVEGVKEIEQRDDHVVDPNVEDMDLGDDVVVSRQSELHASAEVLAVVGEASIKSSTDIFYQTPPRGVKRARVEYTTENEPSVRVVFSSLTRESKRKLTELMQKWSEWQAQNSSSSSMMGKNEEALESGEEIYYPALHVGSSTSNISTMSFWIDNQARSDNVEDETSVPLYDREFSLGSSHLDGGATLERSAKDDARCFNCGSYGHALKECPKPRNMAAISNARKEHSAKKNHSNANHGPSRYYQTKPGKFDDLKPGFLGPETRECLGIGEFDPPPWLHRMREMGYPPGYLETVEDKNKPSGIMIFNDEEEKYKNSGKKDDYEEGELPGQSERSSSDKIMTVMFPGFNAPIPEKADPFLWSVNPLPASTPIYPPSYNPYDQYNGSSYQSSTLNRSLSDRGRYDGSLSHSPHSKSSYPHSSTDLVFGRDSERERGREFHDRSADLVNLYVRDSERGRFRESHDRSSDLVNLYGRDSERDRGREFHDHRRHHRHHGR